ncbi:MAG: SGNH/GDSL hydrolase family protein [Bacteroidota bacterium]
MKRIYLLIFCSLSLVLISLNSCEPSILGPELGLGNLQIHPYLAIGDGFSAGFSNGDLNPVSTKGLYEGAQLYAFPDLIAGQFNTLRPLIFEQQLLPGIGSGFRMIQEMKNPICTFLGPQPVILDTTHGNGWQNSWEDSKKNHNLSIPHLRVSTVASDSFGRSSPFFQRMAGSKHSDYLDMLVEESPSFFTLWLGTEDVLDYAMTGTSNPQFRPTPEEEFAKQFDQLLTLLDDMSDSNTKGVIGNVPDISLFPYFSKTKHTYLSIENCYGSENDIYLTEQLGGTVETRKATASDKILMSAEDEIGLNNGLPGRLGLHPDNPLSDAQVLDAQELLEIRQLISRYNIIIDSLVQAHNAKRDEPWLVVVDLNHSFNKLDGGLIEDGLILSNDFLTGGVFSLDGIYLTPRGNAFVANEFIRRINAFPEFKASIPTLNLTDFIGISFP